MSTQRIVVIFCLFSMFLNVEGKSKLTKEDFESYIPSPSKSYYLDTIHAKLDIVAEQLEQRGWRKARKLSNLMWGLKWTFDVSRLDIKHPDQIVNHFMNEGEIGTKIKLLINLRAFYQDNAEKVLSSFVPRTYIVSNSTDFIAFKKDYVRSLKWLNFENPTNILDGPLQIGLNESSEIVPQAAQPSIDGKSNIWIIKPTSGARGQG